jgi:hypothetical protein
MAIRKEIEYTITKSGCWNCISHRLVKGYPRFFRDGKYQNVSHYMYKKYIGPIPAGKIIRHKCDNTLCVNPNHLELGTKKENMQDMIKRRRGKYGINSNKKRLNEKKVVEILEKLKSCISHKQLSIEYGVSESCISRISYGKSWIKIKRI